MEHAQRAIFDHRCKLSAMQSGSAKNEFARVKVLYRV
jgi:hypothetical protein